MAKAGKSNVSPAAGAANAPTVPSATGPADGGQPAQAPTELMPTRSVPHGEIMSMPSEDGLIATWNQTSAEWQASFGTETVEGFNKFMAAKADSDKILSVVAGQDFIVVDWLVHKVTLTNQQTGEVFDALRLVFICQDGTRISTTSPIVLQNWGDVLTRFGRATLNPPLKVRVKQSKAANVGFKLRIEWVEPLSPVQG